MAHHLLVQKDQSVITCRAYIVCPYRSVNSGPQLVNITSCFRLIKEAMLQLLIDLLVVTMSNTIPPYDLFFKKTTNKRNL